MDTKERARTVARVWRPRLAEPDMSRECGEANVGGDTTVGNEHRLAKAIETIAATSRPADGRRNATLLTSDHLIEPRLAVRHRMFAHLDPNPAPAHFERDCRRRARTEKAVENQI